MRKRCGVVLFLSVLLVGFCGLGYAGIDFESQIPIISSGDIIIDGSPADWEVLSQNGTRFFTLQDDSGDSDCGPGTDINAIYLARDDEFLYWRMDNYDGFSFGDADSFKCPMIHFYDTHGVQDGLPNGGVKWEMRQSLLEDKCGVILANYADPDWTWVTKFEGCDYGTVNEIAEGKIPLILLDAFQVNHILGYYYSGIPDEPCDILTYTVPQPFVSSVEFFVQARRYEDGREFNQFSINLFDSSGNTIPEDILNYVELKDPDGLPVAIYDFKFETLRIAFTGYDGNSGQWQYPFNQEGEIFRDWADYAGTIQEQLKVGTYRLTVYDSYGKIHKADFNFNGQVDLPIIKASSFKKRLDKEGNLIWEWEVPYYIDPSLRTSVRAWIGIHQGKDSVGMLQARLPTHMGRLFVPSKVVQKIMAEGDRFSLVLLLRTSDNNNRAYSKAKKLNLMKLMVGDDDDDDEEGEWFGKRANKKQKGK